MDKDNIIMSIYVAAEEVGTGHVYSDGATLTILLFFYDGCFSSSGPFQQVQTGGQRDLVSSF